MKIHGLGLFVALSLTTPVWSQGPAGSSDNFLPPSPRSTESGKDEPQPLPPSPSNSIPPATQSANSPVDMESELKQFRSELREFQAMREDVARSAKTADADADRITMQQRQELVDLLTKLANKGARLQKERNAATRIDSDSQASNGAPPVPPVEPSSVPSVSETIDLDTSTEIADPFSLGKVLYRAGDFAGAERAFRKATVEPENEMTLKYLMATCIRRQSRWKDAIAMYKVVAESNQDPVLRDLAKWQLDNIRWVQESESQLEKMRKQREKQIKATNIPTAEKQSGR